MNKLRDVELMAELQRRFEEKDRALHDLRAVTINLEDLNRKLQDSEELKSNFLSNIRNEINNPLSSIIGLAKQLSSGPTANKESLTSMARTIYKETFGLNYQLKNIFAAADIEAGEIKICGAQVDLDTLLRHTVDSFAHCTEDKKLTVKLESTSLNDSEEGPFFRTDPEKVQLILSNLLGNAIEYSEEGGTIIVTVEIQNEILQIAVEDHGIVIDSSKQKEIFDRFRQVESGICKSHRGHGIGLSVTKALIEILQGNISVSSSEREGTIFAVSIPAFQEDIESDTFSDDGNVFFFSEDAVEEQES